MQQNKFLTRFIPIDQTKKKTIARIGLGIYILIIVIFFNIFAFQATFYGYQTLKMGEIIVSYFAIYGTIFCFYARTFLYCSVLVREKNVLYKVIMLLHQIICAGVFFAIVIQMFTDTAGRISWYSLRVFNDYEFFFLYVFLVQWMGYLIGVSVKRIVINVKKFIAEKEAASFIRIILAVICIIIGFFVIRFIVGNFSYQIKSLRHLVEMDLR